METESSANVQLMTVEELSSCLKSNGIPEDFCTKFEGESIAFFVCSSAYLLSSPLCIVENGLWQVYNKPMYTSVAVSY